MKGKAPTRARLFCTEGVEADWLTKEMTRYPSARNRPPLPSLTQRRLAGTAGAVASGIFHSLILAPIILGATSHKTRVPNIQGAGASAIVSSQEPVMTLIFINDNVVTERHEESDEEIASRGMAPPKFLVSIASPDPTPALDLRNTEPDENAPTPKPEAAGDQSGHALMFGRYMGQIKARIERAWLRPRTPIGASSFACRVQIVQDNAGNVTETTLQYCNGDERWQISLVQAVRSASPLPAPPDPAVFADALTLEFDSGPFLAGNSDEGFESETRATLTIAAATQARAQLLEFADQLRSRSGRNAAPIELTLHGNGSARRSSESADTTEQIPSQNPSDVLSADAESR
jgi:TonB C terminal